MQRSDGALVPIIPLSAEQAYAVADSPLELADLPDDATALVANAVGRSAHNPAAAHTLLDELAELIARRTNQHNE